MERGCKNFSFRKLKNALFSIYNNNFIGLILFKLPLIPAGTTDTLPVVFTANGGNQAAINYNTGVAMTVADFTRSGVYLAIYDSEDKILYVFPTSAA